MNYIIETILDLLFPRRCPVCGQIIMPKGNLICPGCIRKLSWVRGPVCKCCGKEIISETAEYCSDCAIHPRSFSNGMSLLNYNEISAPSLAKIKYHNHREYLDFYAEAAYRKYAARIARLSPDLIIPVPVHKSRMKKRGFNQAEEFGKRLSHYLEIPMNSSLLIRSKKTVPQKDLGPALRLKNLEQAFSCRKLPYRMKKVLLIDDIYTTGSTAEACSRALKKAGAEQVFLLVIATSSNR
ncbi:putative uncharacterized protein [Clostridium sp. CAG:7]|nr:putative uncharacterized protein [Clostridium sp. CAG:7]